MQPIWQALYEAGAELVLSGHDHHYERLAPQTSAGIADPVFGIREFVVGTGGRDSHRVLGTMAANSEVTEIATFGVLRLELGDAGYTWGFVPEAGRTFTDGGVGSCHGAPTPTPAPTPSPTPAPTPAPTPPPAGTTLTFSPVADARVQEANATTNFGTETFLRADGAADPDVESYLRFTLAGIGTVQSARLRVYAYNGTVDGPAAYATGSSWTETGLTWANRPARTGAALADRTAISPNTWVEYDVTAAVTGNGSASFVLAATSSDGVDLRSREYGTAAERPQLVVTFSGSPTPTPTPGPTPTPTPAPTPSPTPAPTPAPTPPPAGTTLTFSPVADARVQEANATTNFGTETFLRADGAADPDVESYLRFTLAGIGTVQSARLRVYAYNGTVDGPAAYATGSSWTETGLTWANRPARTGAALADRTAISPNTWVEYDVTAAVTGNGSASFVLAATSSDGVDLRSREYGTAAERPQLVVTFSGSPTPTPTPGPTPTPTPAPTPSPTPAPTPAPTPPPAGTTLTFSPVADARVQEANATTNFGTETFLRADGAADPDVESYLRFTLAGIGTVQSARLRVYAYNGTVDGPAAYATGSSWTETGLTWANRPARTGAALADRTAISPNTWVEYDVTAAVTGNGSASFVLAATSSDGVDLRSREYGTAAERPQLVVTFAP